MPSQASLLFRPFRRQALAKKSLLVQFEFFLVQESPPGGTAVHYLVSHCSMRPAVNTRHFSRCRALGWGKAIRAFGYSIPTTMCTGPCNVAAGPLLLSGHLGASVRQVDSLLRVVGYGVFRYLTTLLYWCGVLDARMMECTHSHMFSTLHTHTHTQLLIAASVPRGRNSPQTTPLRALARRSAPGTNVVRLFAVDNRLGVLAISGCRS